MSKDFNTKIWFYTQLLEQINNVYTPVDSRELTNGFINSLYAYRKDTAESINNIIQGEYSSNSSNSSDDSLLTFEDVICVHIDEIFDKYDPYDKSAPEFIQCLSNVNTKLGELSLLGFFVQDIENNYMQLLDIDSKALLSVVKTYLQKIKREYSELLTIVKDYLKSGCHNKCNQKVYVSNCLLDKIAIIYNKILKHHTKIQSSVLSKIELSDYKKYLEDTYSLVNEYFISESSSYVSSEEVKIDDYEVFYKFVESYKNRKVNSQVNDNLSKIKEIFAAYESMVYELTIDDFNTLCGPDIYKYKLHQSFSNIMRNISVNNSINYSKIYDISQCIYLLLMQYNFDFKLAASCGLETIGSIDLSRLKIKISLLLSYLKHIEDNIENIDNLNLILNDEKFNIILKETTNELYVTSKFSARQKIVENIYAYMEVISLFFNLKLDIKKFDELYMFIYNGLNDNQNHNFILNEIIAEFNFNEEASSELKYFIKSIFNEVELVRKIDLEAVNFLEHRYIHNIPKNMNLCDYLAQQLQFNPKLVSNLSQIQTTNILSLLKNMTEDERLAFSEFRDQLDETNESHKIIDENFFSNIEKDIFIYKLYLKFEKTKPSKSKYIEFKNGFNHLVDNIHSMYVYLTGIYESEEENSILRNFLEHNKFINHLDRIKEFYNMLYKRFGQINGDIVIDKKEYDLYLKFVEEVDRIPDIYYSNIEIINNFMNCPSYIKLFSKIEILNFSESYSAITEFRFMNDSNSSKSLADIKDDIFNKLIKDFDAYNLNAKNKIIYMLTLIRTENEKKIKDWFNVKSKISDNCKQLNHMHQSLNRLLDLYHYINFVATEIYLRQESNSFDVYFTNSLLMLNDQIKSTYLEFKNSDNESFFQSSYRSKMSKQDIDTGVNPRTSVTTDCKERAKFSALLQLFKECYKIALLLKNSSKNTVESLLQEDNILRLIKKAYPNETFDIEELEKIIHDLINREKSSLIKSKRIINNQLKSASKNYTLKNKNSNEEKTIYSNLLNAKTVTGVLNASDQTLFAKAFYHHDTIVFNLVNKKYNIKFVDKRTKKITLRS